MSTTVNTPTLVRKIDRTALLSGLVYRNRTLFLRRFWTDDLPEAARPTRKQVAMFQDTSRQQAAVCGRKVLKTTFIESVIIGDGLRQLKKREDGLFTTPADAHMAPVLARIEHKLNSTPIFHSMVDKYNKNDGILQFRSGYWWNFRIEGVDGTGRNMVGLRVNKIICDEAAFGAQKAHDARVQVALSPTDTKWMYTGVPNGVRLTPFWRIDQEQTYGRAWSIHRMDSFENPAMRTDKGRDSLAEAYGGENANEYLNNVLGKWGEERASSFPSGHIEASQSYDQPFHVTEITELQANAAAHDTTSAVPWRSLLHNLEADARIVGKRGGVSVLGIDHGFSPDPWVCAVFYLDEEHTALSGEELWRQLARITLYRIDAARQADCIDAIRSIINDNLGKPVGGLCADMMGYAKATYTSHLFVDPRFDNQWYKAHCVDAAFGTAEHDTDENGNPTRDPDGRVTSKLRKQTSTELLKEAMAANVQDAERARKYLS